MMRIGGLLGADQTRLLADESEVFLVAVANGLSDRRRAGAEGALTRTLRRGSRRTDIGNNAIAVGRALWGVG